MVEGMRERGYIPGQNLVIECRYNEGREERAPALAAETRGVSSLTSSCRWHHPGPGGQAGHQHAPIVMVGVIDPVGRGLVASLARPGGNVHGADGQLMEMEGKRLELLKQAVPKVSRVAVLSYSTDKTRTHLQEGA